MALVEAPRAGIVDVRGRVDARDAETAQMILEGFHHRRTDAFAFAPGPDVDVVELRHERPARGGNREAHHAAAHDLRCLPRDPDEAELGPRDEEIERASQRFGTAVTVDGGDGAVVGIGPQERTKELEGRVAVFRAHPPAPVRDRSHFPRRDSGPIS